MAITILHWNARSIFKKLPELKQYLAGLTALPDVICIQETHLTPKYRPVFPNYTILRQDRPPFRSKGSGLLICMKTSLDFSEINLSGPSTCMEVLGVTVGGYAIFNVYNPPSHHMQTENFVFLSRFRKVVLCGNFNVHHGMWGSLSANHNRRVLLSVLETHDFVVLNTSVPTHYSLSGRYEWRVVWCLSHTRNCCTFSIGLSSIPRTTRNSAGETAQDRSQCEYCRHPPQPRSIASCSTLCQRDKSNPLNRLTSSKTWR